MNIIRIVSCDINEELFAADIACNIVGLALCELYIYIYIYIFYLLLNTAAMSHLKITYKFSLSNLKPPDVQHTNLKYTGPYEVL